MKRQDATTARTAREPDEELDRYARDVIACAVEVHRALGPGFYESVYEHALAIEMEERGLAFERQVSVAIEYRGQPVGVSVMDLMIAGRLVVELKAVEELASIHAMQVRDPGVLAIHLRRPGSPRYWYAR